MKKVTVTADPPPTSTLSASTTSSPNEEVLETGDGATIESLNFRLRYIEEFLGALSRNMADVLKRVRHLEKAAKENNKPAQRNNLNGRSLNAIYRNYRY